MKLKRRFFSAFFLNMLILLTSADFAPTKDLTDENITNAVQSELMYNSSTPSHLIDIETSEGVVTLTGSVNSILARDRAGKIARTVKGVRAVINRVDVDAPDRTNAALEHAVEMQLLNDPATDSYEISINANDGNITLTGTVESWQEKQLAAFVAKGVRGVTSVDNNIEINYKKDRSDFEIQEDVEKTLKNDIRIDAALVDVEVNDGNVNLSGTVGSANEKQMATAQSWVMGVNKVDATDLEVKEWTRDKNLRMNKYVVKSDDQVKEAVEDAFLYDPRVLSFNPEVTVDNGMVTLTGEVDNLKAKHAAEQDAKNVVGVFAVNNYLKVRPVFMPENADLESDVVEALKNDPVVEKWKLDVTADNGIVYLYGTVNSHFEKAQAEDAVSKVKGVVEVENNIEVSNVSDRTYSNYYGWNTYYPFYISADDDYKTGTELKNAIESQLWWSPYVEQDDVEVKVSGNNVILEGTVETEREKLYAEINAIEGGADEVINNLDVGYTP